MDASQLRLPISLAHDVEDQPRDDDGRWTDSAARSERAKLSHKPSTQKKQARGDQEQKHIAQLIGGEVTPGNEPFDVVKPGVAVEVKAIQDNDNNKVTMHPDSRRRKEEYAQEHGLTPHTVAVDLRGGKRKYYYKQGVGAYRLSSMQRVTSAQLRHLIRTSSLSLAYDEEDHPRDENGRWTTGNPSQKTLFKEEELVGKQHPIQTPQFQRWFGKSKVVDDSGRPLVVYHGTTAPEDFNTFAVGEPQTDEADEYYRVGSGGDPTTFLGSHFAKEVEVANKFAKGLYGEREGSQTFNRVYPVYLKLEKPYEVDERKMQNELWSQKSDSDFVIQALEEAAGGDPAKAEKYDARYERSANFRNDINRKAATIEAEGDEPSFEVTQSLANAYRSQLREQGYDGIVYRNDMEGGTSYVIFDPEQVKSATGNEGAFNPKDPDITAALNVPIELNGVYETPVKLFCPLVRQTTDYYCGPAVLVSVLTYLVDKVYEQSELATALKATANDGCTPDDLARVATHLGVRCEVLQGMTVEDVQDQLEQGRPVILDIQAWGEKLNYPNRDDGHYVVAVGFDAENIYVMDPSTDNNDYAALSKSELPQRWFDREGDGEETNHCGVVFYRSNPVRTGLPSEKVLSLTFDEDEHPRDASGKFTEKGSGVPAEPGSTPIPEGHIRLYHYTKGPLEASAENLRKNGIDIAKAVGHTYGEPDVVWASVEKPDKGKVYAEFSIPRDDPALDRMFKQRDAQGKLYPLGTQQDVFLHRSIKPEELIAVHEPWHHSYRYLVKNNMQDRVKAGEFDYLLGKGPEGLAVARMKAEKLTHKTETPNFKRWFRESKVVDEQGKPKVVYHGTVAEPFNEFKTEKEGFGVFARNLGAHFAEDPSVTDVFTVGQYIRPSDYNINEWKPEESWYRDSEGKLRYEEGTPTVAYKDKEGREQLVPYKPEEHGHWREELEKNFGEDVRTVMVPPGGHVKPVYLSVQNPLVVDPPGKSGDDYYLSEKVARTVLPEDKQLFVDVMQNVTLDYDPKRQGEYWERLSKGTTTDKDPYRTWDDLVFKGHGGTMFNYAGMAERAKETLQKLGYDGVKYRNTSKNEVQGETSPWCWIAFEPTQIKSATGNKGTFDPMNKDITATLNVPLSLAFEEEKHPRDEKGRWTDSGSVAMVSPNVSSLHIKEAMQKLESPRQKALASEFKQVDRLLSLHSEMSKAIGAWPDEGEGDAENSTLASYPPGTPLELVKAAAAMKGLLANQKAVLVFQPDPNGEHDFHSLDLSEKDAGKLHESLLKAEIPYHTIVPTEQGSRVFILSMDHNDIPKIKQFAENNNGTWKARPGTGLFIGADTREKAVQEYEREIGVLKGTRLRDRLGRWNYIRDRWSKSEAKRKELAAALDLPFELQTDYLVLPLSLADEPTRWITVHGRAIPIREGESVGDAIKGAFKKGSTGKPTGKAGEPSKGPSKPVKPGVAPKGSRDTGETVERSTDEASPLKTDTPEATGAEGERPDLNTPEPRGTEPRGSVRFDRAAWTNKPMDERRAEWERMSQEERDEAADAERTIPARVDELLKGAGKPPETGDTVKDYTARINQLSSDLHAQAVDRLRSTTKIYHNVLSQAGINPELQRELVLHAVDAVAAQESEGMRRQLGDHGAAHVKGNIDTALDTLNTLPLNVSARDKAVLVTACLFHDMGYLAPPSQVFLDEGHARWSEQHYNENLKPLVERALGRRAANEVAHIIRTHDSTDMDWKNDSVASAVRLADNLSVFHTEKLPPIFRYVPGNLQVLKDLGAKNIDAREAQKRMVNNIDSTDLNEKVKEHLREGAHEVSAYTPKVTLGMLGGTIAGTSWKDDHVVVTVQENAKVTELNKLGDFGQSQFSKLAKTFRADPERFQKDLNFTFRRPNGTAVLTIQTQKAKQLSLDFPISLAAEWEEELHPRGAGGLFVEKGEGTEQGAGGAPPKIKDNLGTTILKEAKRIPITTEVIIDDSGEGAVSRRDYRTILERLTPEEKERMEEEVEETARSSVQGIIDDRDEPVWISDYDVAEACDWEITDVKKRADKILEKEVGDNKEAYEKLDEALTQWYEDTSGIVGEEAVSSLIDAMPEATPQKVKDALDDLALEARKDMEEARTEKEDQAIDQQFRDLMNEYDRTEDEQSWLREFYDEHDSEPRFSGETSDEQMGRWGTTPSGETLVYKFKAGEDNHYFINVTPRIYLDANLYDVSFSDERGSYGITGAGHAHEVFRKVCTALASLVQKKDVDILQFTASEPSRHKLYDRLVKSIGKLQPGYKALAADWSGTDTRHYLVGKADVLARYRKHYDESERRQFDNVTTLLSLSLELRDEWFTPGAWTFALDVPLELNYEESEHPRAEDGRWTSGEGGVATKERPKRTKRFRTEEEKLEKSVPLHHLNLRKLKRMPDLEEGEDISKAGFVRPSGKMMDLSDGDYSRVIDHHEFARTKGETHEQRYAYGSAAMEEAKLLGYIRFSAVFGDVPSAEMSREPTEEQYQRLGKILEDKGIITIDALRPEDVKWDGERYDTGFGSENNKALYGTYALDSHDTPEKMKREIKQFYKGNRYDSLVRQFHVEASLTVPFELAGEFEEAEHPRDETGKFTEKGTGTTKAVGGDYETDDIVQLEMFDKPLAKDQRRLLRLSKTGVQWCNDRLEKALDEGEEIADYRTFASLSEEDQQEVQSQWENDNFEEELNKVEQDRRANVESEVDSNLNGDTDWQEKQFVAFCDEHGFTEETARQAFSADDYDSEIDPLWLLQEDETDLDDIEDPQKREQEEQARTKRWDDLKKDWESYYDNVRQEEYEKQVDKQMEEEHESLVTDAYENLSSSWFNNYDDDYKTREAKAQGVIDGHSTEIEEPDTYSLFAPGRNSSDYRDTQRIARFMQEERQSELLKEQGFDRVDGTELCDRIWNDWKGSSTSDVSLALQKATADFLGGKHRLNEDQLKRADNGARVLADVILGRGEQVEARTNGYALLKAHIQATWETTQFLAKKAGVDKVDVYRAVMIPKDVLDKEKQTFYGYIGDDKTTAHLAPMSHQVVDAYRALTDLTLLRNGAASTTMNLGVANSWNGVGSVPRGAERVVLRISAPITACVSLPCYGQNLHNEQELVLAGTRWRGWDAWRGRAPSFEALPLEKTKAIAASLALSRQKGKLVVDLLNLEMGQPHWLSKQDTEESLEVPFELSLADDIHKAAQETERNPTEAQAKAGNYRKGRFTVHGLTIAIENPKGSVRRGKDEDGTEWTSPPFTSHYGYINSIDGDKADRGADKDHVDVFVGPDPEQDRVHIVNQNDGDGNFDEHKVVLGATNKDHAEKLYNGCYEKGWDRCDSVVELHIKDFKDWLKKADKKKPVDVRWELSRRLDPSFDPDFANECCPHCGARQERGDDDVCNRCGKPWVEGDSMDKRLRKKPGKMLSVAGGAFSFSNSLRVPIELSEDWDENEHPRDKSGQFATKEEQGTADTFEGDYTQEDKREIKTLVDEGLKNIEPGEQYIYKRFMDQTLERLNPKCIQAMNANLQKIDFFPNLARLTNEAAKGDPQLAAIIARDPDIVVTGFYQMNAQRLCLDGPHLMAGQIGEETYYHEAYHAIDGRLTYSDTDAWLEAGNAELTRGQLTDYAAQNAQEGFAEFGRALLAVVGRDDEEGYSHALWTYFPKCMQFFAENDLLPAKFKMRTKPSTPYEPHYDF